jgi:hypothetical protein
MTPGSMSLDHIVLATPDLELGIRAFEKTTGCRPIIGGSHRNLGSKNALAGVEDDNSAYIELIGPDPEIPEGKLGARLAQEKETLSPYHCAILTHDLQTVQERARQLGFEPCEILDMSRTTPDGIVLNWKVLFLEGHDLGGIVPFFIDWMDSVHPAESLSSLAAGKALNVKIQVPFGNKLPELLKGIKGIQCQADGLSRMEISFKAKGDDTSCIYASTSPGGIDPNNFS